MANEVEIIIRAVDKASKEIQNISKKNQKSFTDFKMVAGAALGGVTLALGVAKKAFDMGKEGAQLEFTRQKFDRLSESIGTTSNALLIKLRTATRGTRSDMELIGSAADFASLGLAKTEDQVVRLTRVAGALNMDMNQLVLTLANKTTMRFDQLGVAVDGFDERVKNLEKSGLSVQDAFTEAFLQQAEAQIEKVGDVADTSAGQIMAAEAAIANLADEIKMKLAPAAADAASAMTILLTGGDQINNALIEQRDRLLSTSASWEEYRQGILDMMPFENMRKKLIREERFELESTEKALYFFSQALYEAARAELELAADQVELTDKMDGFKSAVLEVAKVGGGVGRAVEEAGKGMKTLGEGIEEAGEAAEEATPKVKSLLDGIDRNIDSPIQNFIKDLEWYRGGGRVFERTFENIKTALDTGAITPGEADQYMKELYIAVTDFQNELGQIDAEEAAQNINDTMGASLEDAKDWIDGTDSIMGALTALTSKQWFVDITYRYHKEGSPGPGTGGGGYAPGTPGAGDVGLESFPLPTGNSTSGVSIGSVNINASPGMDEMALANYTALVLGQKARRSALAGAGYIGQ